MKSHSQLAGGGNRGCKMPTFKTRQRMAIKIAEQKSAEGYHLSDERCELCEMPLLSKEGGGLSCKVCPAIEMLIRIQKGENTQTQIDDARDTNETKDEHSECRNDELVNTLDMARCGNILSTSTTSLQSKDVDDQVNLSTNSEIESKATEEKNFQSIEVATKIDVKNAGAEFTAIGEMKGHNDDALCGNHKDNILNADPGINVAKENHSNVQDEPTKDKIQSGASTKMPAFKIRQKIAKKVAARKTTQGYSVSDKKCDACEMPLLLKEGDLTCKVCPAIEKLVEKNTEENAGVMFLEPCDDEHEGKGDFPNILSCIEGTGVEKNDDEISMKAKEELECIQQIPCDNECAVEKFMFREGIDTPTFRFRQRVAMKIVAKKTAQGFLVSDKRCERCEMPLLSMDDILMCKVCPAMEKWARKKNDDASLCMADNDAGGAYESGSKSAESRVCDLVQSDYNNETFETFTDISESRADGKYNLSKNEEDRQINDAPTVVSTRKHSVGDLCQLANNELEAETLSALHDNLSPCSILTVKNDSFTDDQNVEQGIEVPSDTARKDVSLVDDELVKEEELPDVNDERKMTEVDCEVIEWKDLGCARQAANSPPVSSDNIQLDYTQPEIEPSPYDLSLFRLRDKLVCNDTMFQGAKYELSGMLDGCKFDLMRDTAEKLRSIFNCNVSEVEDFQSVFNDERNQSQSFEYDEQRMLLVMRGWMATSSRCSRCMKSCMMLRPTDGEMMCPTCDDIESESADIFPSNLVSIIQKTYLESVASHNSARTKTQIHDIVPTLLNQWTIVDRTCIHCSKQLMTNPNLETDHCPKCGPVLANKVSTSLAESIKSPGHPVLETSCKSELIAPDFDEEYVGKTFKDTLNVIQTSMQLMAPHGEHEDILDANMLKELRETMRQIEEAKKFLQSRTPKMMYLPPASNRSLQAKSPSLMKRNTPSSGRPGILKSSAYGKPNLIDKGGRTPQNPGKYFFA